jgi:hypothetical protein
MENLERSTAQEMLGEAKDFMGVEIYSQKPVGRFKRDDHFSLLAMLHWKAMKQCN